MNIYYAVIAYPEKNGYAFTRAEDKEEAIEKFMNEDFNDLIYEVCELDLDDDEVIELW